MPDFDSQPPAAGPILYARGADRESCRLSAVVVTREEDRAPELAADGSGPAAARRLRTLYGHAVWGYDFALPARPGAGYSLGGRRFAVAADLAGDLALAFVSCNGQESGDEGRNPENRDVLWRRLHAEHRAKPFSLLLQGGDQLYADEAVDAHPDLHGWNELPPEKRSTVPWTGEMEEAVRRYFFRRYLELAREPAVADLVAEVPSLMIWDDHDIFDGWGSHAAAVQDSPAGQGLFAVAREMFALFQLGAAPEDLPATCLDRSGRTLAWAAGFPGFHVMAPDLRSERQPTRVMGEAGWAGFERALREAPDGERRIVVSSVPALGPRLSLLEAALDFYPKLQDYEDDLRDQWQSRGHRAEWQRFLAALESQTVERGAPVTVLSGEIHLATRGEMRLADGSVLHQLVASGITHPRPSKLYALGLGALARFGDAPLPGRPIRLCPLPGRRTTYAAERNYLVLTRAAGRWSAQWELEDGGRTPALAI